jgi:hypothetical protein
VPLLDSYVLPADPVKTAGYLIQQTGGVKQAHDAVTAAAKLVPRRKGGRPPDPNIAFWVYVAVSNNDARSKTDAFKRLADKMFEPHAAPAKRAFIRNLERKAKGRTLEQLRQNPPAAD